MTGVKQSIEGVVLERFVAHVSATLTAYDGYSYYAEIDLNRFADVDQPHCVPGARFQISEPGPELRMWRTRSQKAEAKGCRCLRKGSAEGAPVAKQCQCRKVGS